MALLFDLARTGSTLSPLANTATTVASFLSLSLSSTVWQVEALLCELAVGQGVDPISVTVKNCYLLSIFFVL
jgi:hypothetical protein